jgi:predicted ribosomally synthesized peptide with nif11-like leader
MNENIKAFLQKVAADESLQAQFKGIKDPDKAYELAASIQGGFSKDEFIAAMKELRAKMSRDLSDDDLEKAAGGNNDTTPTVCMGVNSTVTTTANVAEMAGL